MARSGDHRAGPAEQIVHGAARGVVEAGIVDRPGREGDGDGDHQREHRHAADLGGAARQELAHRIGQAVDQR
jgi:hypothetical protein